MKRWKEISLAVTAGIFAAANVAMSIYIQRTIVRRNRKRINKTADLSDFVPEASYTASSVMFHAADGCRISGLLMKPQNPNGHAIVVCHGVAHDKRSAVRFIQYLAREGYTLLPIDFRAHGESEGDLVTYGLREKEDLHAAIRYLRQTVGITGCVGVLGASMGASIAIQAAAESTEIDALVLDSPFASLKVISEESVARITGLPKALLWIPTRLAFLLIRILHKFDVPEVEPAERVRDVRTPMLLIHGSKDVRIPVHHTIAIHENASCEKELWIVEGAGHLGGYLMHTREYQLRVLDFFRRHFQDTAILESLR